MASRVKSLSKNVNIDMHIGRQNLFIWGKELKSFLTSNPNKATFDPCQVIGTSLEKHKQLTSRVVWENADMNWRPNKVTISSLRKSASWKMCYLSEEVWKTEQKLSGSWYHFYNLVCFVAAYWSPQVTCRSLNGQFSHGSSAGPIALIAEG